MKNASNFEMLNSGSCDEFEEGDDDKEEESDDSDIETLDIDDDDAPSSAPGNSQLRGLPPGITVTTVVESGIQFYQIVLMLQGGRRYWAVYYTSLQSFIITFPYSLT